MPIPAIGSISPALSTTSIAPMLGSSATGAKPAGTGDFGKLITDLLGSLGNTERTTPRLISQAAAGGNVDVHDVMIATQAESLAFQVGTQVRNKAVEAYQEVFRMQM